jgi:D-galacturonate reductase
MWRATRRLAPLAVPLGALAQRSRDAECKELKPVNVAMIGSGEYTTGYIQTTGEASKSDKTKGVVALVMFDLRRRGLVDRIACAGFNGKKWPAVRAHQQRALAEYKGLDLTMATYPPDGKVDGEAYKAAIDSLSRGDAITIFTPDDTHFEIAMYAIQRGVHVMLTKPPVMTVAAHKTLLEAAREKNVLVQVEYHKRFDPIYSDARQRIRETMGDFQYFCSHMTQPKFQLDTFKAWAGKSSDISYYLNSHHIDIHCWAMEGKATPKRVCALGATGVATGRGLPTEDLITLLVEWENNETGNVGVAVYTSGWAAPDHGEVHSQQRFVCIGAGGEVRADQAHRGYDVHYDNAYKNINPLYMKYTRDDDGFFAGQSGYGYVSFEKFIAACRDLNAGVKTLDDVQSLPTIDRTIWCTAILEAGRRSLDSYGTWIELAPLLRGDIMSPMRFQPAGKMV